MKCIAHRGYSAPGRPENSRAALQAALDTNAEGIEVDLWYLHGRFWVSHDRRLPPDGQRRIDCLTVHELEQLRLHNGETLPELFDVLRTVGDQCLLNLELKNSGGAKALALAIDDFCREQQLSQEHLVVSSFNHHELYACRQHMPHIKIAALLAGLPLDYAACAEPLRAYSFNTHVDLTSASLVEDIHNRGMQSWVYTANFPDQWQELSQINVDAVFTDRTRDFLNYRDNNLKR